MSVATEQTPFEPISHLSLVDGVVDQIERLIVSGVLKEGHRLPPEREFADILHVSRPKLREALKRLETDGLVQTRHGGGSVIAPLVGRALSPAMTELYARHNSAFFDFLEYRREQEGFAAALAAERATPIDLDALKAIVASMEEAHAAQDIRAAQAADTAFHVAITDSGHNTMLIHMMASIFDLTQRRMFYDRDLLHAIPGATDSLLAQHRAIYEAIVARDPAAARAQACGHIDFVAAALRERDVTASRLAKSNKRRLASRSR